jgi:hypothetical protein
MVTKRCQHTAVMGFANKVYIMGGANDAVAANNLKIDVFLYNPATPNVFGAWQSTTLPLLQVARTGHSATLLGPASGINSGKIVVAGGYNAAHATGLSSLELFDPAAAGGNGSSTVYTPTLLVGRGEHASVLAGKWLVMIGGSEPATANISPSVDALDTTAGPSAATITATTSATMTGLGAVGRMAHSAITLSSTSIMVVGGVAATGAMLSSMQKYTVDNITGSVTAVSAAQNLAIGRARFPLLPAGPLNKYLVFGGTTQQSTGPAADTSTVTIELIDASGTLVASAFGALRSPRQAFPAANLLVTGASNFVFLLAGGGTVGSGAEIVIGP